MYLAQNTNKGHFHTLLAVDKTAKIAVCLLIEVRLQGKSSSFFLNYFKSKLEHEIIAFNYLYVLLICVNVI